MATETRYVDFDLHIWREGDRYLAFCDLLFDTLAPTTTIRHRALVRLEDIDPTYDPTVLRNVANYLSSQGVPFGFQMIPYYTDPLGYYTGGVPETIRLRDAPALVNAIRYMQQHGGVLIEHGYTHQYSNVANPYTGVTGDDCEFFRLTLNPDFTLNYLGPVPEDSAAWATNRVTAAAQEFAAAGLAAPGMFTFPSYLASATDWKGKTAFHSRVEPEV